MSLATALAAGNEPHPKLAEEAVARALEKAGLERAQGVLLFLTPEFSRLAQKAVTAAARQAQCLQVAGGIAAGVLTESGWALDRPAAAAMVLGGGFSLEAAEAGDEALFSYAGGIFPAAWEHSGTRYGGVYGGDFSSSANHPPCAWQQSRLAAPGCAVRICRGRALIGVSTGLVTLGEERPVDSANGFDLARLGGRAALESLQEALPPDWREHPERHVHHLAALINSAKTDAARPVAVIAANADGSVTLAERILPGQKLAWAIREPAGAEADMRHSVETLAAGQPAGALMFSCIGRGPFFYGGEDRDLSTLRRRFPGLPILGVYGTGQIAPRTPTGANRHLQNSVVTALIDPAPTTSA